MTLLKGIVTVGGGTASSRVLGLVRDMFIAAALGAGPVAEAYFVAQRIPNLFRRLFAEGAFTSAFVPIFAKSLETEGAEAAKRFGEEALASLAAMLLAVTLLAEIGMVWLTFGLAPGFAAEPDKFDLAVLLSRIAFPYLALISIVTLFAGVLNALGRFAAAAFSQTLLNAALIVTLVAIHQAGLAETREAGIILTAVATLGGVGQLALLLYACRRAGVTLRLRRPRITPGLRRLLALAGPSVIAGGIVQVNIVVGTIIASLQAGAVSWLYYADRLYQLPLGIVGIAIGTVLLPDLSRALRSGRLDVASHSQNRAIEFAAALTLPAAVALLVIPAPIIAVLYERGAFTIVDTAAAAPALAAYALGLPAFVAIKVLQPGFFAHEDTVAPMRFGGYSMLVNVGGGIALFLALRDLGWGHVGVALATSLSAWVNTALLYATSLRRGYFAPDAELRRRAPLLLLASVLMGGGLVGANLLLASYIHGAPLLAKVSALGVLVLTGLALFIFFCQAVGAFDLRALLRRLRGGRR